MLSPPVGARSRRVREVVRWKSKQSGPRAALSYYGAPPTCIYPCSAMMRRHRPPSRLTPQPWCSTNAHTGALVESGAREHRCGDRRHEPAAAHTPRAASRVFEAGDASCPLGGGPTSDGGGSPPERMSTLQGARAFVRLSLPEAPPAAPPRSPRQHRARRSSGRAGWGAGNPETIPSYCERAGFAQTHPTRDVRAT